MKSSFITKVQMMFLFKVISLVLLASFSAMAHQTHIDQVSDLIGTWKIDLTPQNNTDDNFASMKIEKIEEGKFFGEFYRDGVVIQQGQINATNTIHAALISEDNSGTYNSSFYLKNGVLYGTTHAVKRGFLSVWQAMKE
jgi:hypothetical protein